MSQTPSPHSKNARSLLIMTALVAALLCTLPLAAVLAPRLLGFAPALIGVLSLPAYRLMTGRWLPVNRLYAILAFGTAALAALSSLWAIDSAFALERAGKVTLVLGGGLALFTLMRASHINWPRWMAWAFPLSLLLAAILTISELATNGLIHHSWRGTAPANGNLSMINRAVVLLTLLGLPALAFLNSADINKRLKIGLFIHLTVAMAVILILTDSQSAHLIVLIAALFWFIFPYHRPKAWIALGALIIAGILSGPWLAQILYDTLAAQVKDMPWLAQAYAADRLEIWDFVARKALENPLYGFGIEATRHIEHFDTPMLYTPHDHVLHPHNAVLQIWIEFGLIGALGLCAFVAAVLRAIHQLCAKGEDLLPARLALCAFMAVFAVSCTAYGFWQGWWLGLLTLLAALCAKVASPRISQ